ncbi:hypothetical protein D3C73_856230 [compost metagenome]
MSSEQISNFRELGRNEILLPAPIKLHCDFVTAQGNGFYSILFAVQLHSGDREQILNSLRQFTKPIQQLVL